MRQPPTLHLLQHEVRRQICSHCQWRTPGTDSYGPEQPRECEKHCIAFTHMPEIVEVANQIDPLVRSPAQAVRSYLDHVAKDHPPEKVEQLNFNKEELLRVVKELEDNW